MCLNMVVNRPGFGRRPEALHSRTLLVSDSRELVLFGPNCCRCIHSDVINCVRRDASNIAVPVHPGAPFRSSERH